MGEPPRQVTVIEKAVMSPVSNAAAVRPHATARTALVQLGGALNGNPKLSNPMITDAV